MPAKLVAGEAVFIGRLGPPDKGAVMQTIDGRLSIGAEVVEVGPTNRPDDSGGHSRANGS